ncbi:MAG: flagellar export protein FliJ [Nitrosomonas sp.]|nr:flagellar export protein FliJ [Nitrosomonas sp.]
MSIKQSSLQILLDHAQKQSDDAAKKLGLLTSHVQKAEQKLNLLLEYRHSYQSNFQDSAKNGVNQVSWLNFNAFMKKLDTAIAEQRQNVENANNNRKVGGTEFRLRQSKLKSYDTLSKRQQQTEIQQQIKAEQKEQDEFASNISSHNQRTPKSK